MARPIGETIARRRVFWLLVALVVVPTLFLAGYGLAGLKNQRDAAQARLRDRYLLQARLLEQEILARLQEEDVAIRIRLRSGESPGDLVTPSGLVDGAWRLSDADIPEPMRVVAARANPAVPLTFTAVDEDTGTAIVGVSTISPEDIVAWRIRPGTIDALVVPPLVGRLFPNEPASYHVEQAVPEPTGEPVSVESIRRQLSQGLEPEPQVDRAMEAPFDQLRITIIADDVPAVAGSTRTTLILAGLVLLVVAGVTLLGRAVVQQVRLSRLQTDFVSHISHELRTPLTSIRIFIETLQSGRVTDEARVRECLDIIATESDRLNRKIERVLSWARLEAGRRIYTFTPTRPREVVDRTLDAFRTLQLDRPTEVVVDVPHDLPLFSVDTEGMEEVLLNLLSNAQKYGGPSIRVLGRADRKWVYLTVADDGPGIPKEEKSRIFEKFYRPDLLQTRRQAGSGLGLAIVKAIVSAHRGRVEVESEEGKGAAFTVRLRRA